MDMLDICHICLSTDRKLKIVNTKLSSFHSELCDISIGQNPLYCYECEYLLKKMYNFKMKCTLAMEKLQSWIKAEATDRNKITDLYTQIPPVLQLCSSECETLSFSETNMDTGQYNINQDLFESSLPHIEIKEEIPDHSPKESVKDNIIYENEKVVVENVFIKDQEDVNDILNYESMNNAIKNDESDDEPSFGDNDEGKIDNEYDSIIANDIHTDDSKININFLKDFNHSSDDDETLLTLMKNEETKKKIKKRPFNKTDNLSENEIEPSKRRKSSVSKETDSKKSLTKKIKDKQSISTAAVEKDCNKKSRFHMRTDIIAELTNCLNSSTQHKNGNKAKSKTLKQPYTKERLIEEIKARFSKIGELKTSDGTPIDKQFILQCLEERATDFLMEQLYRAVYRKPHFKPRALKLFKCIQDKFKTGFESVFDMKYLNTVEKMFEEFEERKTYECYINAEFKCEICYQGFKHEKKLLYHMKSHDESAGDCVCAICKTRFRNKKALINHLTNHEAVYKCKLCPLITYYKSSMKNHFQLHKGTKYKCEQCNVIFGSVSAYRTHVSYRHARTHACVYCGRAYRTRMGLQVHCNRHHKNEAASTGGVASVPCDECGLSLASWDAFHKHKRIAHKQAPKGRPPGRSGGTRVSKFPRKKPVITCRVCNSVGESVGWLQLHFSEHHPTIDMKQLYADKHTHLCDVCGKSFCSIYSLQSHLNMHAGVRPYACDLCSARFYRLMSLRMHRLVHLPPAKPCTRCGKKFKTASNLNNHMRSHIGNRRYKCSICGKGFLHRNSVNEHVRGVHKNIRRVRKKGVSDATRDPERGEEKL